MARRLREAMRPGELSPFGFKVRTRLARTLLLVVSLEAADPSWLTRGTVGNVTAMAPERITVTIQSSVGEEAFLTVDDAMRQVLDLFSLLSSAGGPEAKDISWQLVSVSMKSPLQVTAQAVPVRQGVIAENIASREKASLFRGLAGLAFEAEVPQWMDKPTRERAKAFLTRNLDGIGRTDLVISDDGVHLAFEAKNARQALNTIDAFEKRAAEAEDLSRAEYGSVEALVLDTTTFRNHPALKMRTWLGGYEINCVFSEEVAERVGPQNTWRETWQHKRFIVRGEITYKKDGLVSHVYATDIEDVVFSPLKYEDIADPLFTGGLGISAYLDSLGEGEDG